MNISLEDWVKQSYGNIENTFQSIQLQCLHENTPEALKCCLPQAIASSSIPPETENTSARMIYAGNAVLSMDSVIVSTEDKIYIAIGTGVRKHNTETELSTDGHKLRFGIRYPAPNLLQIWSISTILSDESDPTLEMFIAHEGGDVLDVKFGNNVEESRRVAICCADGSLRVFKIPDLSQVEENEKIQKQDPLFQMKLSNACIQCLQWSPKNQDEILCGATDGSLALWQLNAEGSKQITIPKQRFFSVNAAATSKYPGWTAVRAIKWCPIDDNIVATVGQDHVVRLWDIRNSHGCLRSFVVTFARVLVHVDWVIDDKDSRKTKLLVTGDSSTFGAVSIMDGSTRSFPCGDRIYNTVWAAMVLKEELSGKEFPTIITCSSNGAIRTVPYILGKKPTHSPKALELIKLKIHGMGSTYSELLQSNAGGCDGVTVAINAPPLEPDIGDEVAGTFTDPKNALFHLSVKEVGSRWWIFSGGASGVALCYSIDKQYLRNCTRPAKAKPSGIPRGRPRKTTPSTGSKKRGRPRKSRKKEEEVEEEEMDSDFGEAPDADNARTGSLRRSTRSTRGTQKCVV